MKKNKNLIIIAIICLINALGYGIIIPIIYTYSRKFGLNDFQNGMLFALFSICQFLSTPLIGKLSDKYGRRPLLIFSLAGTALSFFIAAFAPSVFFLFLARALDGITAGNIPVATAVISDTTDHTNRAKGFGIIGAALSLGFVIGPAISGFTVKYGLGVPFIIAGVISIIGTVVTFVFLPETNKHVGQKIDLKQIFDFSKLYTSLFDKAIGLTLLITLIYSFAWGLFAFSFQPFAVKILHISLEGIASVFTVFGFIGFITQMVLAHRIIKIVGEKKTLAVMLTMATLAFFGLFVVTSNSIFIFICVVFAFSNSIVNPLLQTFLSKEVDAKSQGTIFGLSSSYTSLGFIFGPIIGGILSTISIPLPFLVGSGICFICLLISIKIIKTVHLREEAV